MGERAEQRMTPSLYGMASQLHLGERPSVHGGTYTRTLERRQVIAVTLTCAADTLDRPSITYI